MVKVIWHKAASPLQTDSSIIFTRLRPWGHSGATWQIRLNLCILQPIRAHNPNYKLIGSAIFAQLMAECCQAHWRHLANTIELVLPSAHPSPQPKWQVNRLSHFCTAHGRKYLHFIMGASFPKKLLLPIGGSRPPWFLGTIRTHNPNGISIASAVFEQTTVECPYTTSNTWFPGPTQVLNPNGISMGSVVFAGLTSVRDRPTDHATRSVTIGRIYVCSTAMQPNNTVNALVFLNSAYGSATTTSWQQWCEEAWIDKPDDGHQCLFETQRF